MKQKLNYKGYVIYPVYNIAIANVHSDNFIGWCPNLDKDSNLYLNMELLTYPYGIRSSNNTFHINEGIVSNGYLIPLDVYRYSKKYKNDNNITIDDNVIEDIYEIDGIYKVAINNSELYIGTVSECYSYIAKYLSISQNIDIINAVTGLPLYGWK